MKTKYYALVTEERQADIYIFGDITSWEWYENDVSSYTLSKEIEGLDVDVINVYINSYGGEIAEGLAIHNMLISHKATVRTYCSGFACSISAAIFMAGVDRYMYPASLVFIHNGWTWTAGNAAELHKAADDLAKISDTAVNVYRGKVNITDEKLQEMLDAETWLTPQEALDMGFATAIISEPATMKASANARQKLFAAICAAQPSLEQEIVLALDGLSIDIPVLKRTLAAAAARADFSGETPPPPEPSAEPQQDTPPTQTEETPPPKQSLSGYIYALLGGRKDDD